MEKETPPSQTTRRLHDTGDGMKSVRQRPNGRLIAVELVQSGGEGLWILRGTGGALQLIPQKGGRQIKVVSLGFVKLSERRAWSHVLANPEQWHEKCCLGRDSRGSVDLLALQAPGETAVSPPLKSAAGRRLSWVSFTPDTGIVAGPESSGSAPGCAHRPPSENGSETGFALLVPGLKAAELPPVPSGSGGSWRSWRSALSSSQGLPIPPGI